MKKTSGLTLLEVVVGIALSSLLLAALFRFLAVGFPLSRTISKQTQATESARVQLRRLTKALREARSSDQGAYAIASASDDRLIFFANVDGDDATERVRYELIGTELKRGVTKPTGNPLVYDTTTEVVTTVVRSVQNTTEPLFTYYTGTYPTDTTPLNPIDVTQIKYIEFILVIDDDPAADPAALTVTSQVQLRNLKDNLDQTS
jgi:type II secretory pathway pseudopilin PulG